MSDWPKHADGRPKKVGEMTSEERRGVFVDAVAEVKANLETPHMRAQIASVLNERGGSA